MSPSNAQFPIDPIELGRWFGSITAAVDNLRSSVDKLEASSATRADLGALSEKVDSLRGELSSAIEKVTERFGDAREQYMETLDTRLRDLGLLDASTALEQIKTRVGDVDLPELKTTVTTLNTVLTEADLPTLKTTVTAMDAVLKETNLSALKTTVTELSTALVKSSGTWGAASGASASLLLYGLIWLIQLLATGDSTPPPIPSELEIAP